MRRYSLIALSAAGGMLSGLAWSEFCPGLILLVSFVPWLLIEDHLYLNPGKYNLNSCFILLLPGFVLFNTIVLSWIRIASIPAAIAVITEMSFLMTLVFCLAHSVRKKAGRTAGYAALTIFWLAFENLSLHSSFLTPWINLGNGLAKNILFIQWYDITGVAGGSLWILISNIFLTLFLLNRSRKKRAALTYASLWLMITAVPAAFSVSEYSRPEESKEGQGSEIVIVQPNFDPYTEKFSIPFEQQLDTALKIAESMLTDSSRWLIFPETMIDDPVNEADAGNNKYILTLRDFAAGYNDLNIIAGLVSYRIYPGSEKAPTRSARLTNLSEHYADHYNSAFRIDAINYPSIYHKSRLVPGIEMHYSPFLEKVTEWILPDMGGTMWGYGTQDSRTCFIHSATGHRIAPVICYESVFGDFVAGSVREGVEALAVITNDGWWKNTKGYYQHLGYSSLRAIETGRPVVRCANTGISCITDKRGKRLQETEWWTAGSLRGTIVPETEITFYVRAGDYIFNAASVACPVILIYIFGPEMIRRMRRAFPPKKPDRN